MSLTTPQLLSISAFDATLEQTFLFNVIGGNQVVANTLTIKNNVTLTTIYSETQDTFKFEHILPAGTLTNGGYYQATLTTKDAQGNVSKASTPIQFYCYSAPSMHFTNIETGGSVSNSSFNFLVNYNQAQGEILNSYTFNLYSASGALITTSGVLYNTGDSLPITVSHLFSGFENNVQYSVECTGLTTHGMTVSTGRIYFSTIYEKPSMFSYLFVENNCAEGYVNVWSNVYGIRGKSVPYPPKYVDDNTAVDLTEPWNYVLWDDGYKVSDNYTVSVWGRKFTPNSIILTLATPNNDAVIVQYCQEENSVWYEVTVKNNIFPVAYVIKSDAIVAPTENEWVFCWLRCVDGLYDIRIENLGVGV